MNDLMFIKKIHLLGIGGSGMSGIAEVLVNHGYQVSGTDLNENVNTQRLKQLGVKIFDKHLAENLDQVDVVIRSTAISDDNPEINAAKKLKLPIIPRAQMLAELMRFKFGVAVTGTHGKTSTTSILSDLLTNADLDPTFVVGGVLKSNLSNAQLGQGKYFVIEADESDASFLYFNPMVVIVTNIEAEHLNAYGNDFEQLKNGFVEFIQRLPFYGLAIICYDDPTLKSLIPRMGRRVVTYGFDSKADVVITNYQQNGFRSSFAVHFRKTGEIWHLNLNLPGQHYVSNSVASIIAAREIAKVSPKIIADSLNHFSGVKRRMERYHDVNIAGKQVLLIDDYGHHPTEIKVTLQTLRQALPGRRILMIFQPHRYTRTRDCFNELAEVLTLADQVMLLNIYPASELPIAGISSQALAAFVKQQFNKEIYLVNDNKEALRALPSFIEPQDVILIQGAGSIGGLVPLILKNDGNFK